MTASPVERQFGPISGDADPEHTVRSVPEVPAVQRQLRHRRRRIAQKHIAANGEDNNDGESDNKSANSGAEGPTDNEVVNERHGRQRRNFLATLLLSAGVPMILGRDELGRTQGGDNNAYCQDNE